MRIAAVEPVFTTLSVGREPMSYCFVRITSDDGRVGWGESCDSYGCTYATVVGSVLRDAFAPLLIKQELVVVEHLIEQLRHTTRRRLGDSWIAVQARSAIEIALWDLLGQAQGKSISALLGRVRDRVPVYAAGGFLDETTPNAHAELFAPFLDRGVRMVKVRIGPEWQDDVRTLAQLRDLLDQRVEIAVDGSETFTAATALSIAQRLHDLGVIWFEEPIPQAALSAIVELSLRSPVPLAYGEHLFGRHEAAELLSRARGIVLQPDAATCGGIAEARQIAQLGVASGARVVPHNCAGPIALAANLHVAASTTGIRLLEYGIHNVVRWDALGRGWPLGLDAIEDGTIAVPDTPGLGVVVDDATLANHPYMLPGRRVAGTVGGLADRFVGDR